MRRFFRTLPQILVPTKPHTRQTDLAIWKQKAASRLACLTLALLNPYPQQILFQYFCNSFRLRCQAVFTGSFLWFGTPAKVFSLNPMHTGWVFQALVRFGNAFCGFCLSTSNPDKSNIKHTDTSKDLAHEECSAQFISQCSRPKTNHTVFLGGFVNICPENHSWKENNIRFHWGSTFVWKLKTVYMLMSRHFLLSFFSRSKN